MACRHLNDRMDKITSILKTVPNNFEFSVHNTNKELKNITIELLSSTSFVGDDAFIQNLNGQVQEIPAKADSLLILVSVSSSSMMSLISICSTIFCEAVITGPMMTNTLTLNFNPQVHTELDSLSSYSGVAPSPFPKINSNFDINIIINEYVINRMLHVCFY